MKDLIAKHGFVCLSSNYALYGVMSNRVMNVLRMFPPQIEVYSIDEAFLNLDGIAESLETTLGGSAPRCCSGRASRSESTSRMQRRRARFEEERRCVRNYEQCQDRRRSCEIRSDGCLGCRARVVGPLFKRGIITALQLRDLDAKYIERKHSVCATRTVLELQGVRCIALEEVTPDRKNICETRGFCRPVYTLHAL